MAPPRFVPADNARQIATSLIFHSNNNDRSFALSNIQYLIGKSNAARDEIIKTKQAKTESNLDERSNIKSPHTSRLPGQILLLTQMNPDLSARSH